MFGLLAVIFAAIGVFMTAFTDSTIPDWLLWAVLLFMSLHMLVGLWPIGSRFVVNRRAGS
jgi:hypothetical protein